MSETSTSRTIVDSKELQQHRPKGLPYVNRLFMYVEALLALFIRSPFIKPACIEHVK
jgi:hypothetical protein